MMIDPGHFLDSLRRRGVDFFTGVPDSLLASFCAYVDDHCADGQHVIAANEGNAVAMALGHHLATGSTAAVYMQNSGLGNAVNPLTSLADGEVYRVPMLLIVGWRGEPGIKDEPQHRKQGRITRPQLDVLEIPHWVVQGDSDIEAILDEAFSAMANTGAPVALVVRKDAFGDYQGQRKSAPLSALLREDALRRILDLAAPDDLIVSTTGKTSRELFDLRVARGEAQRDFLTVGGMGHTASIALGVAMRQAGRRVICLDGDGSLLMHMGAMAVIAQQKPARFVHVLLNNGAHESVGGQATAAPRVDFGKLSDAVGYAGYACADTLDSLSTAWAQVAEANGPVLLELKLRCGSRKDLGRPTTSTWDNKQAFMEAAGD
ncbi:phosphonopyruvate decarboxylase [Azoarcus olearius]|uniref:Phosphonopyruvate decarboxylase, putative n=1 Tax=Azoarcus sp. (strain BH72) TaxID=418699 RepID=A1K910_AZOSB|nr:phosphonopyruvate decarboxylase [Azoarcus olearius]CAL95315.1 phosphonopyruvate decarboxylase, putative [Azoarcus olearius]